MGVRITGERHAALVYDSVTGIAFGPVFHSRYDAETFLRWYEAEDRPDLRMLTTDEAVEAKWLWEDQADG